MSLPYAPSANGACPHCGTFVHFLDSEFMDEKGDTLYHSTYQEGEAEILAPYEMQILRNLTFKNKSTNEEFMIYISKCPNCQKIVLSLARITKDKGSLLKRSLRRKAFEQLLYPRTPFHKIPPGVPERIRSEFSAAAEIISITKEGSAALSRRCLQLILQEQGYRAKTLYTQIEQALSNLPSHLANNLHAFREVGNIGAHPTRKKESGELIDVDLDEARFLLEIIEHLLDFYYVDSKKSQELRGKINAKVESARNTQPKNPP